jgi:cytidylate kinase
MALENNIDPEDEASILKKAKNIKIELESNPEDINQYTLVLLDGRDVTREIRSDAVGAAVSVVSKLSGVRKLLVRLQRKMASGGMAVLEGRDTGSVVCPDAILKVFLTASLKERIRRRKKQNREKGGDVDEKNIKNEIKSRDKIDSSRKDSPLIIPDNAVVIDTTDLSIIETFEKIREIYNERICIEG